ncbi:glutamate--tRNA ligase [Candidatus Dojkabacteria bacterium]|nr:glutamate--tRNA ligase [Candidatus Dojkabacteria bacterium]
MSDKIKKQVRVRAAPSPTGRVHTGNLRTFLNDYLTAKSSSGVNILRVEDTDQNRKVEGGLEAILETLKLFGITFDEGPKQGGDYGPYIQSERLEIYQEHAHKLVEMGHAYYCFCSKERLDEIREKQRANKMRIMYDRHCRDIDPKESKKRVDSGDPYVVRMKFPTEGYLEFTDEIYGKIRVNNEEIDDMVLLKSDGYPTYHFSVVIDDHLMEITHVLRGREYLTQTTRDIFLYNAFGWEPTKWVHVPLLLNPDGKGKLSKRKGAMPALAYLRKGFLPDAVLNYLVLAGWAPKPEDAKKDEIYTLDELCKIFSLDRMKKSNARYDQKKLEHINSMHIRRLDIDTLAEKVLNWADNYVLGDFIADKFDDHFDWEIELKEKVLKYLPKWKADLDYFKKALATEHERLTVFSEIPDALNFFYDEEFDWDDDDWRTQNHDFNELADGLEKVLPRLDEALADGSWDHEKWEKAVRGTADELGWKHGDLFLAIRSATTGRLQSPPLLDCFKVMGWERARGLIVNGIDWLKNKK